MGEQECDCVKNCHGCDCECDTCQNDKPEPPTNWPSAVMNIGMAVAFCWAFRGCCGH